MRTSIALRRFEKFIFLALIFSIPFQKRFFLFAAPSGALAKEGANGFFEWSSGFLYITDFLVLILFGLWVAGFLVECQRCRRGITDNSPPPLVPPLVRGGHGGGGVAVLLVLFFAFISLTQADLIDVGVYRFLKLAEFIFLFFYAASRIQLIGIKPTLIAFVASGVFQSILAILQFAKQSSLGLEVFHESTLLVGLKGVAEISAAGMDMLRAYGTFPSPNVLAGFLGICLLFLFYLFLNVWGRQCCFLAHSRPPSGGLRGSGCFAPSGAMPKQPSNPPANNTASPCMTIFFEKYLISITIFILLLGLVLTFSRGVIIFFVFTTILFFAGMFLLKKFKEYRKKSIYLLGLVIVSWALIAAVLWPEISSRFLESSVNEPAIQERLFFNEVGIDAVRQNYAQLFFGVGIGNFVNYYMSSLPGLAPHFYQPVHNIFILIASEIGIFGLIAFILFLALSLGKPLQFLFLQPYTHDRENNVALYSLLCVACFMLFVGMYDHYFWTLQQGGLMFWIMLGLLAGINRNK